MCICMCYPSIKVLINWLGGSLTLLSCFFQKKLLRAMPDAQKNAIRKSLDDIVGKLSPQWEGFSGFSELQARVDSIKDLISQKGSPKDGGE